MQQASGPQTKLGFSIASSLCFEIILHVAGELATGGTQVQGKGFPCLQRSSSESLGETLRLACPTSHRSVSVASGVGCYDVMTDWKLLESGEDPLSKISELLVTE